MNLNIMPLNGT